LYPAAWRGLGELPSAIGERRRWVQSRPNGTPKMSCSTKRQRSAGFKVSRTTSNANPRVGHHCFVLRIAPSSLLTSLAIGWGRAGGQRPEFQRFLAA